MIATQSAGPCLRQGRGGAWDHRRCGACFCRLAISLLLLASKSNCFLVQTLKALTALHHPLGTPNAAGNRHPKARSMASYGRSSVPFASLWTLKTLKKLRGVKRFKRLNSLKPLKCLTILQAPQGKSYPKARSMLSYGRSSLPFARR